MKKIGIIGPGSIGLATAAVLAQQQHPGIEPIHINSHEHFDYVQGLIEMTSPDFLNSGRAVFVVGNQKEAGEVTARLHELQMLDIDVLVANDLDRFGYPARGYDVSLDMTPAMVRAKSEYWDAQQPRHLSQFTKSQPSAKARKQARRRAKKGRKTNR